MSDFDYTYISYGAGVQSTALLIMSNLGLADTPRADVAIFADTQDEPAWVYETLSILREWSKIPVEIVSAGHLLGDTVALNKGRSSQFASIPLFMRGANGQVTIGRRQCTREYKIAPIQARVRRLLGYEPRQRVKEKVRALVGISVDEAARMKPNRERWITNAWPLVDARLSRAACEKIAMVHLGVTPKRSSCIYCPFHSDAYWSDLKTNHPAEFESACRADEIFRDMTTLEIDEQFVHRSLVPLRDARFGLEGQGDLFNNECEGMCGV